MRLLIQFFIALTPFVFSLSTSDPTLSIRFLYLSVFISVLVFLQFYRKEMFSVNLFKHKILICIMLIFSSYLISTLTNGISSESIYLISKLFLIIIFVLSISNFLIKNSLEDFFLPLILFSFFSSVIYFYQLFDQYDQITSIADTWHKNRAFDSIAGSMGHKNLLSSIQFLLLPVLIYNLSSLNRIIKIFSILSLCLAIIIFFQTQSRAVLGAIIISSIIYLFITKISITNVKKIFVFTLALFISAYAFLFSLDRLEVFKKEITKSIDFSSSQRFSLYKSSINLIADNFIFGVGPGNWRIKIWEYGLYNNTFGNSFAQRPHNDFLWIFSEGGFIAGLSYILLFLILLKDSFWLFNNSNNPVFFKLLFCMFIGYGFISMFDFPFERISHLIIFFVFVSIIISSKIKLNHNDAFKMPTAIIFFYSLTTFFIIYIGYVRYNSEIHSNNAIKLKQKGNWNYVVKAIDKAYSKIFYEIDNTSTPLLWYRGVAYFSTKKYELALRDFKNAYNVNPNHIHVLNNLATTYQLIGNTMSAKLYYDKAIKVNPSFKEARVNLSAILYNEKKYDEALSTILNSKVELYWKRQKNNDNYDLYLKTIFNAYINNIKNDLSNSEYNKLEDISNDFTKQPARAAREIKKAFLESQKLNLEFIKFLVSN
jgi:O-antigen ligase